MSLLISLLFLTVVYLTPLHAAESRGSFEGVEILPSGLETVEESIDFGHGKNYSPPHLAIA